MFDRGVYKKRRNILKRRLKSGIVLILGNSYEPMNFEGNNYRFRQDSTFLYYCGIDREDLVLLIDIDNDREIIFGDDYSNEEKIWIKKERSLGDLAICSGVDEVKKLDSLVDYLKNGREVVRFLPQYRCKNKVFLSQVLGVSYKKVNNYADEEFIKVVVDQRLKKEKIEVEEILKAISVTKRMVEIAFDSVREGVKELEVLSRVEGYAIKSGMWISFPTILTRDGAILHNTDHSKVLRNGDMVVFDSGVETKEHYASDITRTIPVGKFLGLQKDIYDIVIKAQEAAFDCLKEGVRFIDVHMEAVKVISSGLRDLGFLKGSLDGIIDSGSYALFFPHGLGHPLGLDVHDMEALGEEKVGYDETVKRSNKFGLKYLRFAREIKEGYVMTIEPGIYFIPKLIDKWASEGRYADFINYDMVLEMSNLGGIRVEDDVLIRKDDYYVLSQDVRRVW